MARRLPATASEDDDYADASKAETSNAVVKREGRKTRARGQEEQKARRVEVAHEDHEAESQGEEQDEEEEDTGISKGAKRRRLNVDGDSVPSRAVSQEVDEEEDGEGDVPATQLPKPEYKTLPRDTDGYIPGSIVRIQLKNFLNYDFVEFRPGPYLNMIIGPNGSGKSSIACAICLGLNFPPNVLGRANEVKAFVKQDRQEGYTEIELKGPKGKRNLVVRRNLRADTKTTSFTLNGKSVSGQEIKTRMAELNVQVGNLCTFLPQDKVSSFAAMSPQDLLKETQRAAGDDRLSSWHQDLIQLGEELRELKSQQTNDDATKNQAQQRIDMMQHTVRLFKERKQLELQHKVLANVVTVEKYRLSHIEYLRLKKKQRISNARAQRLKQKNQPIRRRLEEMLETSKELQIQYKAKQDTLTKRLGNFHGMYTKLEELEDKVDQAYQKLESLKREEADRLKQMTKLQSDIESTENEMRKPSPKTEDPAMIKADEDQAQHEKWTLEEQHKDLEKQFKAHVDKSAKAKSDLQEAEARIQSFTDSDTIKLQNMQKWHRDTHDAVLWLRKHRHFFKMEVFEPPYMCMTVPNQRYQAGVEALISSAQLRTFVAQCKEDIDTLNHHINDTEGLGRRARIVTWFREYNERQLATAPMSYEEMKNLGFEGYAIDYVECPEGLKWFLKKDCNLHRNALALNAAGVDVGRAMEAVGRPETGGGASFICGTTLNQVQRSRYGSRALNNMTRDIPRARNLTVQTVDPEVLRQAQEIVRTCQEQLTMCEEERKELDRRQGALKTEGVKNKERIEAIKKRKEEIMEIEKIRVTLERRLQRLQGQLKSLKSQPSEESQKKKLQKELVQRNFERAGKIKDLTGIMKTFIPEQQELTTLKLDVLQKKANCEALEELIQVKGAKFQNALAEYEIVNRKYKESKARTAELLETVKAAFEDREQEVAEEADRISNLRRTYLNPLAEWDDALEEVGGNVEELLRQGLKKPERPEEATEDDLRSLEELEIACRTVQEQLEFNNNKDESIIRNYEEKQRQVEQLTAAMHNRQGRIDTTETRVKRTRDQWEPSLRNLINEIRTKFSDAFDRIGCAGDVELVPEADFAQWRVDIKVKFRDNEKLQSLTAQRQSGGERSLTTILYLMSLTTLAHTPFSLVDEINQGMDKRAERTVHNSMVDVTCKEESSQYFLITPKLLPDLKYHQRMRILCVNNGYWIAEEANGDMKTLLKTYAASRASATSV